MQVHTDIHTVHTYTHAYTNIHAHTSTLTRYTHVQIHTLITFFTSPWSSHPHPLTHLCQAFCQRRLTESPSKWGIYEHLTDEEAEVP